jgi:hypothetical protein
LGCTEQAGAAGGVVTKGSREIKTIDDAAEALAIVLCKLCGIEPVDTTDGSANWMMFFNDAKRICEDIGSRMKPWWYDPKNQ